MRLLLITAVSLLLAASVSRNGSCSLWRSRERRDADRTRLRVSSTPLSPGIAQHVRYATSAVGTTQRE